MQYAVKVIEVVEREVIYVVDADSEDDAKGLGASCEINGSQEEWFQVKRYDVLSVNAL